MKTVSIVVGKDESPNGEGYSFDLALIEGCEPDALDSMLQRRVGICNDTSGGKVCSYYLTAGPNRLDTVVPLTVSLPADMKLYFHKTTTKTRDLEDPQQQQQQQPPPPPENKDSADPTLETSYLNSKKQHTEGGYTGIIEPSDQAADGHDKRKSVFQKPTRGDLKFWKKVYFGGLLANSTQHGGNNEEGNSASSFASTHFRTLISFNQIGTDLANERTLLAWIRTMLACIRTIFAYEKQVLAESLPTLLVATMMIATLLLLAGFNSGYRYFQVRKMLLQKDKPQTYSRFSLMPFILLAFATAALTSIETYLGRWNQ